MRKRENSLKIGVKFCGNCNPHINTVELFEKLKNYYKEAEFVKWDDKGYDLLIVFNSCPVRCACHPDFSGPKIIVDNNSINYEPVLTERLLDEIMKTINKHL
jgi:hypothetical protein